MKIPGIYPSPDFTTRQRIAWIMLFFASIISTEIALRLYAAPAIISPLAGVALAGLILGGVELWPAIFLGALITYLANSASSSILFILPAAYTIQAIVGAYFLQKTGFETKLGRLRDMVAFIAVALGTSAIAPTVLITGWKFAEYVLGRDFSLPTWGSLWTGGILSTLVITPLLVRWIGKFRFSLPRKLATELVVVILLLILISYFLFWTAIGQIDNISLVYFLLVPLMWSALRFGTRFTTVSIFLMAIIGILGTMFGAMAPAPDRLGLRLFQVEVLINILTLLFYILVAIEEERRAALKRLQSHVTQLEEAVGMRDDFISVASHELKTPVTTLKIYSQVMQRELGDQKRETLATHMQKMDKQLDKLVSLVEDLLSASRARMGKLEFHKEMFDLNELVRETVEDIQPSAAKHVINIEGQATKNVWGDKDRISQVLVNFLNNAIKYSPQSDSVLVLVGEEDGSARVGVRDYGIGIDMKHHEKIFDLFYRVTDTDEKTFPGFGIGLNISKEIIERHSGKIGLSSIKGEGSEFSFTIPYADMEKLKVPVAGANEPLEASLAEDSGILSENQT